MGRQKNLLMIGLITFVLTLSGCKSASGPAASGSTDTGSDSQPDSSPDSNPSNSALDTSFGTSGCFKASSSNGSSYDDFYVNDLGVYYSISGSSLTSVHKIAQGNQSGWQVDLPTFSSGARNKVFGFAHDSSNRLYAHGVYTVSSYDNFFVCRIIDGSGLDSTFGNDGCWTHTQSAATVNVLRGHKNHSYLAIGQNEIYLSATKVTQGNWHVIKLSTSGATDTSYGTNGVKGVSYFSNLFGAKGIQLDQHNRLLAYGEYIDSSNGTSVTDGLLMAADPATGLADQFSDTSGYAGQYPIFKIGADLGKEAIHSVVDLDGGKQLVVGSRYHATNAEGVSLFTSVIDANGVKDSTYGTNGLSIIETGISLPISIAHAIALSSQELLAVGTTYNNTSYPYMVITKVDSDGNVKEQMIPSYRGYGNKAFEASHGLYVANSPHSTSSGRTICKIADSF